MTKIVKCGEKPYDIYIGRPSKWGNPFVIGVDGSRKECIEKYRNWIMTQRELLDSLHELDGKILGCWCGEQKPCHGHILIELLQKKENNEIISKMFD